MCCESGHHRRCRCGHHHARSCGCDEVFPYGRWLATKEEKIAWLEQVLKELQEEAKGVEERIAAFKKE
jgi:hypothetical protein